MNVEISAQLVKQLREKTGAGILDCREALAQSAGDVEKAIEYLRKKGIALAAKKATRVTKEGLVHAYIHGGGRIGVLIEVNCETDFVARTSDFKGFVNDLALQVAAGNPLYIRDEDVPDNVIEKEKEIYRHQAKESGKPDKILDKIVEGRVQKYFDETCILRQPFVKDSQKTIQQLLQEKIALLGENIIVRRFVRFHLGEGE